jgi:hypothetical protein
MWIVFDTAMFLLRGLLVLETVVVAEIATVVVVVIGVVVPLRHRPEFSPSIRQQQFLPSCLR